MVALVDPGPSAQQRQRRARGAWRNRSAGADDGLPGISQSKSAAGNKGGNAANGVAGRAGTTNGQPIDSIGGSVSQLTLMRWLLTAPPPGTVVAGAGFGMTVSVENGQGQVDTSFAGPMTALLSTDPNGATLGGTVTVDAHDGVAVFSGLTVNRAGNGDAIAGESGGVTSNADNLVVSPLGRPPPPPAAAEGDGFTGPGPEQAGGQVGYRRLSTSLLTRPRRPLAGCTTCSRPSRRSTRLSIPKR